MNLNQLHYVPIEAASKPANGEVLVNYWWITHPEREEILFWRQHPRAELKAQANQNESITRTLISKLYQMHRATFVPAVYLASVEKELRNKEQDK